MIKKTLTFTTISILIYFNYLSKDENGEKIDMEILWHKNVQFWNKNLKLLNPKTSFLSRLMQIENKIL